MRTLFLYSTPACHLCETAHELISPWLDDLGIVLEMIDISASDELVEIYGIRIPVLRFQDYEEELGWPFTAGEFLQFARAR